MPFQLEKKFLPAKQLHKNKTTSCNVLLDKQKYIKHYTHPVNTYIYIYIYMYVCMYLIVNNKIPCTLTLICIYITLYIYIYIDLFYFFGRWDDCKKLKKEKENIIPTWWKLN
jgi:hypothetical protein